MSLAEPSCASVGCPAVGSVLGRCPCSFIHLLPGLSIRSSSVLCYKARPLCGDRLITGCFQVATWCFAEEGVTSTRVGSLKLAARGTWHKLSTHIDGASSNPRDRNCPTCTNSQVQDWPLLNAALWHVCTCPWCSVYVARGSNSRHAMISNRMLCNT